MGAKLALQDLACPAAVQRPGTFTRKTHPPPGLKDRIWTGVLGSMSAQVGKMAASGTGPS